MAMTSHSNLGQCGWTCVTSHFTIWMYLFSIEGGERFYIAGLAAKPHVVNVRWTLTCRADSGELDVTNVSVFKALSCTGSAYILTGWPGFRQRSSSCLRQILPGETPQNSGWIRAGSPASALWSLIVWAKWCPSGTEIHHGCPAASGCPHSASCDCFGGLQRSQANPGFPSWQSQESLMIGSALRAGRLGIAVKESEKIRHKQLQTEWHSMYYSI